MNGIAITYPVGLYNPAGTKAKFYYAFADEILTFPVLPDPGTALTFASLVELATAIVMKPGKQFFEHYATSEENEVKCTLVGPRDGKGFESSLEYSYPGNDATQMGFLAATANRPIVAIVPEKNNVLRVLGSIDDPAYVEAAEYTSGKKIADGRKTVVTLKASAATPAPIYKQTMTSILTPAA